MNEEWSDGKSLDGIWGCFIRGLLQVDFLARGTLGKTALFLFRGRHFGYVYDCLCRIMWTLLRPEVGKPLRGNPQKGFFFQFFRWVFVFLCGFHGFYVYLLGCSWKKNEVDLQKPTSSRGSLQHLLKLTKGLANTAACIDSRGIMVSTAWSHHVRH